MIASPPPTERAFGRSVGSVCVGLAAVSGWRGRPAVGVSLLAVGLLLVGCASLAPSALRVPNRVWWRFAQTLGWINTRLLLTVFFTCVLTPVGVGMRMFGRNPLRAGQTGTNWTPARRRDSRHFEHLF
jgi:hypothetical protein